MSNLRILTGRHVTSLLIASLAMLLVPGLALGHAELETATPADGSTVTEPVTEVIGTYSAAMLPDKSRLVVRDADGKVVARGGVDPDDDTRMIAISESPLGDGEYEVQSVATATDGDLERATWTFTVAVAASPTPTATATPTATPTGSPSVSASPTTAPTAEPTPAPTATPTPSADDSAAGGTADVILPIIIVLVVLGVGAAYLLTRRNRPSDPA